MSEASARRGPQSHGTDEFWRKRTLEDVMTGIEPWRDEDAGLSDLSDEEWEVLAKALAE